MEAPRSKNEIGDEDPAPAPAAVAAGLDLSTEAPLPMHEIRDDVPAPAPAPTAVAIGEGGGALQQLIDHEDGLLQPAAGAGGGGGLAGGALQQLIELGVEDRRLQAVCFFLVWGCSMIIYGTELNPSTNWEHIFVGFVVFTIGAGLALLTLAGGGAGRAAARAERFLRGFF